jgi:hypothetical protein
MPLDALMSRLTLVPAILLLFLPPACAQSRAVLRPTGSVKINGKPAADSTVVMDGDRIATDEHSSALLLLPGRAIMVGTGSNKNGGVTPNTAAAKITTATCHGLNCTTSSSKAGSGTVQNRDDDDDHEKKKCISPKKPKKDKDCDKD